MGIWSVKSEIFRSLANGDTFTMIAASWSHVNAICDNPRQFPISKVKQGKTDSFNNLMIHLATVAIFFFIKLAPVVKRWALSELQKVKRTL